MFLNLFKVELKRHIALLGSFIAIEIILNFILLWNFKGYYRIADTITTIIWFLVPIYIFIDLYRDFHIGDNTLIHLLPMKTSSVLLAKILVFSLLVFTLWSTNLIVELCSEYGIYQGRIATSSKVVEALAFFILPRMVSIVSGIIIIGLSISLSKLFKNIYISSGIIGMVLLFITSGIKKIMLLNFSQADNVFSTIVAPSDLVFKQYAGLVTYFVARDENIADIATSIQWNNVFVNVLVGALGFFIMNLIFKSKKYELKGSIS